MLPISIFLVCRQLFTYMCCVILDRFSRGESSLVGVYIRLETISSSPYALDPSFIAWIVTYSHFAVDFLIV